MKFLHFANYQKSECNLAFLGCFSKGWLFAVLDVLFAVYYFKKLPKKGSTVGIRNPDMTIFERSKVGRFWKPDVLDIKNVRFLNGSGFRMVRFRIPTVQCYWFVTRPVLKSFQDWGTQYLRRVRKNASWSSRPNPEDRINRKPVDWINQ